MESFEASISASKLDEIEDRLDREDAHILVTRRKPLRFQLYAKPDLLERLVEVLERSGCRRLASRDLETSPAPKHGVLPDDSYATSNQPTYVFLNGEWRPVLELRMDGCIRLDGQTATCTLMRDIRAGEMVVTGHSGVRTASFTAPDHGDDEFGFMTGTVSSERQAPVIIGQIASSMKQVRDSGGKIVFVPGPAVIHTGGVHGFCGLVEKGYVHGVLSGNALAVHDIENALFGTSLGVDTQTAKGVHGGHRHHLEAINRVRSCGSIVAAVDAGVLNSGIMHALVTHSVPFVLAGSIRDDGPLPDTEMDLIKAQRRYAEVARGASMVVMIATMLHSIGVGNMIPARCRTICVDINHAVVSKLADRGSKQAVGVVTDAGLFLDRLDREVAALERQSPTPVAALEQQSPSVTRALPYKEKDSETHQAEIPPQTQ
ncbi:MAG: TIGR00300 family protein [Bacillota bacterium]|nr:TIGR00300 family protein [Bacillota bacterium]